MPRMSDLLTYIEENKQDAITWRIERLIEEAGEDIYRQAAMVKEVVKLLSGIKDSFVQNGYIQQYTKRLNLTKKHFTEKLAEQTKFGAKNLFTGEEGEEDPYASMPKWMDKDSVMEDGFCAVSNDKITGYYGWGAGGKLQITNFLIHPIFHVYEKEESTHIFEVQNHRERTVMEVPSKALVSPDIFQNYLVGEGNFIIYGSKAHMLRVATKLLDKFERSHKIKQLGWQSAGFFAWCDKVYKPGVGEIPISKWGIVNVDGKNYLIPSASEVYKDMKDGDNDPFENERFLTYAGSGTVSLERWAKQLFAVYGETGLVIVAYFFITLFYDIVFDIDNNCPHLYLYGERSSGKSKASKSLRAPFAHKRSPWQMNSGTDAAFFGYVSAFKNTPNELNEFEDKVVRDEWFQATKGFFDGEGRGRNAMDARNKRRQEVQRATGTVTLIGQFLSTKDDNSIVTRSLIQKFYERQITEKQKKEFNLLQEWESEGLSSLIPEALDHRAEIKRQYREVFNQVLSEWRTRNNDVFNQRVMQNWCHTATMWKLVTKHFTLPVNTTIYDDIAYKNAVHWSQFVRSTDILSEFWNTVEYLLDTNEILAGWDFRIDHLDKIKLRNSDGKEEEKVFSGVRKLLIIRLNTVHKKYMESHRKTTGKEGMGMESLKHYYANRNYYIGQVKQCVFKKFDYVTEQKAGTGLLSNVEGAITSERKPITTTTSAYVFDYDLLNCNLDRSSASTNEEGEKKEPNEIF